MNIVHIMSFTTKPASVVREMSPMFPQALLYFRLHVVVRI